MKINVTFECTPEEMRSACGLPDVQPLQTAVMAELQNKVKSGFAMDPAEMIRGMFTQYVGGIEQLQSFLARVEQAATNRRKE